MIKDFQMLGIPHLSALMMAATLTGLFLVWGCRARTEQTRRRLGWIFAVILCLIRGARYGLDVWVDRFDIWTVFSLHICHLDLILLVWCLIKPNQKLFNMVTTVGIPVGLIVALFPGRVHPEPGMVRAILFIMIHALLAAGPLYLAVVEKMTLNVKCLFVNMGLCTLLLGAAFTVNIFMGTNYLFIMEAPKGTYIEILYQLFDWPGYVGVMYILAMVSLVMTYSLFQGIAVLNQLQKTPRPQRNGISGVELPVMD